MKKIHIFATAAQGKGLSGGDRIFIEFARRWQKKAKVFIYVNEEGRRMCRRQGLSESPNLKYIVWDTSKWRRLGFGFLYFVRILKSISEAFHLGIDGKNLDILYSASEFWMDSLPTFVLKSRFPRTTWVAAWFQTAPNPFRGYAEGDREKTYNFKALLYWLIQLPIKPLIARRADFVLINNEDERKRFPHLDQRGKLIVVIGAIDLDKIDTWREKHGRFRKIYDAVFQGRFHPQKGVVELVEIWSKVVEKKPDAKLAMIGNGPLMEDVKRKVKNYGLNRNVSLLGYVFDGDLKYKTFSQSKIVVHPALYDSGGMASAEAMAFGLPVIGFNLKAYKSYYPKGMLKVKIGDLDAFADAILMLLHNEQRRLGLAEEALDMLGKNWSWDERASQVLDRL